MHVLYLSFLPSQKVQTILAYVLSLFLLHGMSSFRTKKMVSVVVARQHISILNDLVYMTLYLECFMRWRYSKRLPVSLSGTAYVRSHKNCSGYYFETACFAVNGALYPGISMHCSINSCVMVLISLCCCVFAYGGMSFLSCVV
jgi:hypothetical protein